MDNTLISSYLDAFIPVYMQYRGCKTKEAAKSNIAAKEAFGKDIVLSDINLQTILYAVQHSTTYSYTILFSLWLTKRGLIQDEETNRLLNAFGPFFMREIIDKKVSPVVKAFYNHEFNKKEEIKKSAGRPKKYKGKTKVMRIPEELVDTVNKMIEEYNIST